VNAHKNKRGTVFQVRRWEDEGVFEMEPRDWGSGDDTITGAQASYLKTLSEQAHKPVPNKGLTTAEASELIDKLKEQAGLEK
jgi:hypothetical protein